MYLADHDLRDRHLLLTDEREAYWQPQPPAGAAPQHDAFSDGSQHVACLVCEQQLGLSPSTFSRSSCDADVATDSTTTAVPTRVLRFFVAPALRADL